MARTFARASSHRINTTLPAISDEITLVASYRCSTLPAANGYSSRYTLVTREFGSTINYLFQVGSTSIQLTWTSASNVFAFFDGAYTSDTNWHTCALSHKWNQTTSSKVYVDGTSRSISTPTTSTTQTAGMTTQSIGGRGSPGEFFNGDIGNIAIYNRVLSNDEMVAVTKNISPLAVNPQNLQFYAPLFRELIDVRGGVTLTNVNSTVATTNQRIYL